MSILRGEVVCQTAMLSPNGDLIASDQGEFEDFFEEECRKSFKRGVCKGEQVGYEKARNELQLQLQLLQKMAQKVLEQKQRLLDQLKPEIIAFTMSVCEHILREELSNPVRMARLLHALLHSALPSFAKDRVKITLAPHDFDQIVQELELKCEGIRFVADPTIASGDCRIESQAGLLHFDLRRELSDLQAKVLER